MMSLHACRFSAYGCFSVVTTGDRSCWIGRSARNRVPSSASDLPPSALGADVQHQAKAATVHAVIGTPERLEDLHHVVACAMQPPRSSEGGQRQSAGLSSISRAASAVFVLDADPDAAPAAELFGPGSFCIRHADGRSTRCRPAVDRSHVETPRRPRQVSWPALREQHRVRERHRQGRSG